MTRTPQGRRRHGDETCSNATGAEQPIVGGLRIAVAVLAGGQSTRMGRDKARLRWGGKSLLSHVRSIARPLGWPVHVVRQDSVPRCGPLGGIYTAFQRCGADAVVFLACDMPFVSPSLLRRLRRQLRSGRQAVFASLAGRPSFPCVLRRETLPIVTAHIERRILSLQALARALSATLMETGGRARELANINTPADLAAALDAQRRHRHRSIQ